jgi:hypothetical protein
VAPVKEIPLLSIALGAAAFFSDRDTSTKPGKRYLPWVFTLHIYQGIFVFGTGWYPDNYEKAVLFPGGRRKRKG